MADPAPCRWLRTFTVFHGQKELFRHRIIRRFLVDYDLLSVLSIPSYHLRNVFQCSWPMLAPCPASNLENWNLLWEVVLHIQSSCIKPLQQTVYLVTKLQQILSPEEWLWQGFLPFFSWLSHLSHFQQVPASDAKQRPLWEASGSHCGNSDM